MTMKRKLIFSICSGLIILLMSRYAITLDSIYQIKINLFEVVLYLITFAWGAAYGLLAAAFGGEVGTCLILPENGLLNIQEAFFSVLLVFVLGSRWRGDDDGCIEYRFIIRILLYGAGMLLTKYYLSPLLVKGNYFLDQPNLVRGIAPSVLMIRGFNQILFILCFAIIAKLLLCFNGVRKIFGLKSIYNKGRLKVLAIALTAAGSLLVLDFFMNLTYMSARGFRVSIFTRITGEATRLSVFIFIFNLVCYVTIDSMTKMLIAQDEVVNLNQHLTEMVEKRTEELRNSYESLESYSYTVSHELKTPVREIRAYADVLTEDVGKSLPAQSVADLAQIRHICDDTIVMIEEMMEYAKAGYVDLNIVRLDLGAIVKDCTEEICHSLPDREIAVDLFPLQKIDGDRFLIRQAVFNILSNAVKFSDKEETRITVGNMINGDDVTYYFADNGVGFDSADANKVFGLFNRMHTKKEFEGNGIGLATVKKIIERHGGTIQIYAEKGKGCVVFFTLFENPKSIPDDETEEVVKRDTKEQSMN